VSKRDSGFPPVPMHKTEPIGYQIEPRGHEFHAFLVYEGGESAICIAEGRNRGRVERQAVRRLHKEHAQWEAERQSEPTRTILYGPSVRHE
jgi:hypothetical protein